MKSADGAKWTKDNLGTRRVNKAPFCTRARELVPCSVNAAFSLRASSPRGTGEGRVQSAPESLLAG